MLAIAYVVAQIVGGIFGVIVANLAFGEVLIASSSIVRCGYRLVLSEFIVTFVLVLLVLGLLRSGRGGAAAAAVGAWVVAIVLASPSAGFANPAVTVARGLTDTYTGIAGESILWFVVVQLVAGVAAAGAAYLLFPIVTNHPGSSDEVLEGEQ
ncbi:MAG: hypothetical protein ACR2NG_03665 [Acidimicrobiia bacterium]